MQVRSAAAWKESAASGACGLARAPESLASPVRTAAHGHLDNAVKFLSADSGSMKAGGLDGERYEAWVAGVDPGTGEPRGRLRTDSAAVRFVEVVANGRSPGLWRAELHPNIAQAYEAAHDSAVRQITGWLGQHATTRVGPRGAQVAVPVQRLEVTVIRHYTSRAGDPHRHLHVQINARVFATTAPPPTNRHDGSRVPRAKMPSASFRLSVILFSWPDERRRCTSRTSC